jgi:hypothetical protein
MSTDILDYCQETGLRSSSSFRVMHMLVCWLSANLVASLVAFCFVRIGLCNTMQQPLCWVQMCSPRGHTNLLTSNADPTWRAVRKAVAAAFSVNNMRKKYPVSGHVHDQPNASMLVFCQQLHDCGVLSEKTSVANLKRAIYLSCFAWLPFMMHAMQHAYQFNLLILYQSLMYRFDNTSNC